MITAIQQFISRSAIVLAAMAVPFTSCSADPVPVQPEQQTPGQNDHPDNSSSDETQKPEGSGSGTLIVWYSFTGNSKAIATALKGHIEADVLEIKSAEEGLDYAANNYAIGSSLIAAIRENPSSASSYPAIKKTEVDWEKYNTVIVVTPLWWSQMAAPMQSFLFQEGARMAGKTIGLIVTSASSGISGVEQDARRLIPKGAFLPESLWIRSSLVDHASTLTAEWYDKMFTENEGETSMKVKITVGGKAFTAEIEDSQTGKAFLDKLPLTLDMSELNGNEKYCYGVSLPRNDQHYGSIVPGDLMLYSGNCLVLFYGAAGGYSYTRVGKIADTTGLAEAVGKGSVTVIFEQQ